ncbi:hypothetical protein HII17_15795 [Thalassotalea sp. M1531]|uniref:Uncharacterized protein n=1 Tax=Thalassotalea algicola TaxID=2716224 RepID=A0A7Y0Q9A9_9GAMM|nr:hypothetical protein [Thalassotalea algicola]NMP33020.1 hypothetical protein [Thalassotalea algicola]
MNSILKHIVLLFALISPISSCSTTNIRENEVTVEQLKQQGWQIGTVTYQSFEGGFYGITSEKGDKYLVLNLPSEMKVANSLVAFKGQLNKDIMTIQQWGTPFKLSDIKMLKKGLPNNAF